MTLPAQPLSDDIDPRVLAGRAKVPTLKEHDIKSILLEKIDYMFEWKSSCTLDGWLHNIANWSGTFGDFYGDWDTGSVARSYIEVRLDDGRTFKFKKSELFNKRVVQVVLL